MNQDTIVSVIVLACAAVGAVWFIRRLRGRGRDCGCGCGTECARCRQEDSRNRKRGRP